jgi:hypothetical protein
MYINNYQKCNWIRKQFEDLSQKKLPIEDIERGVKRLIQASKYVCFYIDLLKNNL